MEHHLFDDSDPELVVRPAAVGDAESITRLSTQDLQLSDHALEAAQGIVEERLSIISGDDYFTIVAERPASSEIVGWLAGGGCRGQELKGWGELYALSSDPLLSGTMVDEALVAVAVHALDIAQFAGVTVLVECDDRMRSEMFEDFGFTVGPPDEPGDGAGGDETGTAGANHRTPDRFIRYSLDFKRI